MINVPLKMYELFDDTLIAAADEGVSAWNWATGRPKEDLANLLIGSGVTLFSVGAAVSNPLSSIVYFPLHAFFGHNIQKSYTQWGITEKRHYEKGIKDFRVEQSKNIAEQAGLLLGVVAYGTSILAAVSRQDEDIISWSMISASFLCYSSSTYVMRTDTPPKYKKNVFSRAGDYIANVIQAYRRPALNPVRID